MNNGDFIFLVSIDKVSTVVEPVTDQSQTDIFFPRNILPQSVESEEVIKEQCVKM